MNKTSIKNYAVWARNELINRVSQKAFEYGVEKDNILPYDADNINGGLLSEDEKKKRQTLINEVKCKGYDQVIEEVAYTWFNRFIALRYMEVNNYLPDKVRLFTNENNEFKPQIIDEALHIDLMGINKNKIIALKEANNNEDLYKELLLATCNDMSRYLPGMFKPISDYMTLLFPSNLLREESVLGRLITDIDENSWTDQVQIIGWLYQYYNTDLKDKTFADLKKNVKITKDTVAPATQIFTPDWIVRYMTENSLGRLWLDGHQNTEIKSNWKYYLDEAEQEESVQIELNKIKEEHAKLKPKDIKLLDPCMGSGHILVYAFDVFMQIYISEGWTEREAAKSILQNNIYGLDIDERAYQLSYFALMMKARQYNRRILSEGIVPNVMAIEESNTFNKDLLRRFGDLKSLAERVVSIFIDAKEYGSILNIEFTKEELDSLENKLNANKMADYGNLLDQLESDQLYYEFYPLLKQARIMSQKYECVVTNPPYMGGGNMSTKLSEYVKTYYPNSKNDLSTVFMEKTMSMCTKYGYMSMINIPVWMFLSSYENLRKKFFHQYSIINLVHPGRGIFGSDFGTTSFIIANWRINLFKAKYRRLFDKQGDVESSEIREKAFHSGKGEYLVSQENFFKVPGMPVAYWVGEGFLNSFGKDTIGQSYISGGRNKTHNNERYLRVWWEVSNRNKWQPYDKGGDFRRWYGNYNYLVDWSEDAKKDYASHGGLYNQMFAGKEGISWTNITAAKTSFRIKERSHHYDSCSSVIYNRDFSIDYYVLGLLNSNIASFYFDVLNPTIHVQPRDVMNLPFIDDANANRKTEIEKIVYKCIENSKNDWDSTELSYGFSKHPILSPMGYKANTKIEDQLTQWIKKCNDSFEAMKDNEEKLNKLFLDIYQLSGEVSSVVSDKDITIRRPNQKDEIKSLISYAVGCMFGRYSLDVEGLAYAGGEWDNSKYKTFIPDKDNIIPICDDEYFNDDITGRFIEFIKVAYGEDTLEENLRFIADALGGKGSSREVIRNYFINDFYKDHCNTYQVTGSGKRPIYWQFDSGKQNGFKALIYIHRYTPDLIARIRTSYVHEQQSRYDNLISMIQNRIDSAVSTSERVKAEKELKKLKEQADELRVYEEKIHHWADKMEPMDLDDGVKANYAKFQELLTKIK